MQCRSNVKQCILECKYPSFWDILFRHFWISDIQNITRVKQIWQICLHDIYLLALVFKRESLCNWQHLDIQVTV